MDRAGGDLGGGEFQAEGATGAKALRQEEAGQGPGLTGTMEPESQAGAWFRTGSMWSPAPVSQAYHFTHLWPEGKVRRHPGHFESLLVHSEPTCGRRLFLASNGFLII